MLNRIVRAIKCTSFAPKCYSFFLFLGSLILIAAFSGCQSIGLPADGGTSIFKADYGANTGRADTDSSLFSTLTVAENGDAIENRVYGALVSTALSELEFLLNKIENRDKYLTVAVLASTEHSTEKHKIFTYESNGVLGSQGIRLDDTAVNKLITSNIVAGLGEIKEGSYWTGEATKSLQSKFPDAKFVFISINNEISDTRAELLASALKSYLPGNSIVLALAEYAEPSESLPPAIKDFQKEYVQEILGKADFYKFGSLPLKNNITAKVLGYYLQKESAKKSHLSATDSGYQAYFSAVAKSNNGLTPAENEDSAVYLVSFGDIMLGRYVRHLMDANGMEYAFKEMDESYLKTNDLLLANLEGPVTEKSVRTTGGMNFGFFPDVVPVLKKYHFDIVSQANNHTFDKGKDAFPESFGHLKNGGITPFGNPNEITDDSVAYMHIRGQKFAFFGLEEVNTGINDDAAVAKIKEVTEKGYNVIVVPHWGVEYNHKPTKRQKELGHKFIDAGAYAVIGHHPHVVQTIENYNGHPIIYSLGNAIFDQYWSAPTQEGLSVAMKLQPNRIEIYLAPIKLPGSRFQLKNETEREEFINRFISWADYTEEEQAQIRAGKMTFDF